MMSCCRNRKDILKKGIIMEQYALLKHLGRHEYVVVKYTDHCLGVLAHFLTDGGSADNFRSWIETTDKGEAVGEVTFLKKNGNIVTVGLIPVMTGQKDQLETTQQELLSYIDTWNKKIENNPHAIILKHNGKSIEFEILEHHVR